MAFCAAATVVVVSAAAAAATRWNVKRMSPPPNRYTCAEPHDTPSPVGHFAGATGLARTVWFTARGQDRKEHTSELQSRPHLVCRLLLEKNKRRNSWCYRC